jgi:hypothetical protein
MKSKFGPPEAITAAHKLARPIYRMITARQEFDPNILAKQDEKRQQKREAKVRRQARQFGYDLVRLQSAQA